MQKRKFGILRIHVRNLYVMGGIAAMLIAFLIPLQGIVYAVWPAPESVTEWFELFQTNKIIGLINMDLLLTIDYLLVIIVFMALWAVLKRSNPMLSLIALLMLLVSVTIYFTTGGAFEMLELSNQYNARGSYSENLILQSAAKSLLLSWRGTAFDISYILGCIAIFTMSFVMMQSNVFTRLNSYFGILAGVLMAVPITLGLVGITVSFLSLLPTVPWLILIGQKLFQLSKKV
jgi:hypothetical protein